MENLIKKAFGISAVINPCKAPKSLPFYMTNGRHFYHLKLAGITSLLIELSASEKFGVIAFEKQLTKYVEAAEMPAAFIFNSLNKVQRDALTERNIPFVCLPDQLFLPFLGMAMSNRFIKEKAVSLQKMAPLTQVLFLYFLYKAGDTPIIKKQAAEDLNMTRMSVTRASEQLREMGLLSQEPKGKEQLMRAVANGKEFYEMAKPFLINPVQKTVTTVRSPLLMKLTSAGETALSLHSMLNSPAIPVVAAYKQAEFLQNLEIVDEKWQPERELVRVEFWKYDPEPFSCDGSVDPVSLAESLKDIHDERIQGELEDYLEDFKW